MDSHSTKLEIKEWDVDELLDWILRIRPKIFRGDDIDKFKEAKLSGEDYKDFFSRK
jgi:hypothetical protein